MLQAVAEREFGVSLPQQAIHRLQIEAREIEALEDVRLGAFLGKYEFQLIPGAKQQVSTCLGAHARPVDPPWWELGSIGLDRDLEPLGMERLDKCVIELKERFASCTDDVTRGDTRRITRPDVRDGLGEVSGGLELSAARSIHANEVCIAEATNGSLAILLAPCPKIAPREAAKDGRPASLGSLTLQGIENLFD